jgi:diaminopimelate decarboxylase
VGDVIAVMDAGAYFIPNQMNFSNPRAAAVAVREGVAREVRARETFERIVECDLGLPAQLVAESGASRVLRVSGG